MSIPINDVLLCITKIDYERTTTAVFNNFKTRSNALQNCTKSSVEKRGDYLC